MKYDDYSKVVADWVSNHPGIVMEQFDLNDLEFEKEAHDADNWSLMLVEEDYPYEVEDQQTGSYIGFDCEPYDDQLRAYVYFEHPLNSSVSLQDNKVVHVHIQGE